MIYLYVYIVGFIVTAGAIGGVRDEMEGIGDMAMILFWPISLVLYLLYNFGKLLYQFGKIAKDLF